MQNENATKTLAIAVRLALDILLSLFKEERAPASKYK